MKKINVLKIAGKSNVGSVAGSIVKSVENNREVELRAIGAGSCNQCVKSIATARGILASKGLDCLTKIGFSETSIEEKPVTMMIFRLVIN